MERESGEAAPPNLEALKQWHGAQLQAAVAARNAAAARAGNHSAHVTAMYREVLERRDVARWSEERDQEQRDLITRALLMSAARLVHQRLSSPVAAWLVEALREAARTGNANLAFGLARAKGGSSEEFFKKLHWVACVHALQVWFNMKRSEACDRLGFVDGAPDASQLRKWCPAMERQWTIRGPLLSDAPDEVPASRKDLHRAVVVFERVDAMGLDRRYGIELPEDLKRCFKGTSL
jgi:hypothetical protein